MPMFKANINALEKAGIRDQVIVMVGGAPVTQEYADAFGADGYSADASTAVHEGQGAHRVKRAAANGVATMGGLLPLLEHAVKGRCATAGCAGSACCTRPA